jgi:cytoskeletal protein RodZ
MKKPWWQRRRNLPLWGMLSIWLVMSLGFAAYNWFLVLQDEAVAPREQMALGTINHISHGKHDTAHYSFTYAGKEYHDEEMVRSDQTPGDAVVYFDPTHPSTSSLVEYRRKSKQDRSVMKGCLYAAIGLTAALTFTLFLKWKKKDSLEKQASLSFNR